MTLTELQKKSQENAVWIVSGLILLAIVFSFLFFQRQSLRLDEAQSLWQTSHTPAKIINLVAQDVHVPLYHMILHFWQFTFGNGVVTARLLSLIFFLASIPALYLLGKTAFTSKVALFATAIFAISPFMNWYANEIRMYSLFVLLTILNQYFFLRLFKHEPEENLSGIWAGFAVTAVLGVYTHYFFFLTLATNALFYFFNKSLFPKKAFRSFVWSAVLVAVAILPWLTYKYILGQAANTQPTLQPPTSINLFNTFSQFIFGFQTDHLNTILLSLWPLTILLGFLALRRNKRTTPQMIYFILGFIVPNILAFVASFIFAPVYLTRYLIFALPPMYLFLSAIISTYPRVLAVTIKYMIIIVMLVTLGIEAVSAATPVKENYADAATYIQEHADPTDVIVVSAPFTIYPMLYYYQGPVSIETLPRWDRSQFGPIPAFSEAQMPKDIDAIKGDHQNMWLLLSYDQGYQEKIRGYMDSHYQLLQKQTFSPGMTLYEYKLRYDTPDRGVSTSTATTTSAVEQRSVLEYWAYLIKSRQRRVSEGFFI